MSLLGHLLARCSILWETEASLCYLCALDVVCPCLWEGSKRLGQQHLPLLPNPFAGCSWCTSWALCVAEGWHVPAACLWFPAHSQGWCVSLGEPAGLEVSGAWHNVTFLVSQLIAHPQLGPDRLFLSLFCINLRHCSTSSDVTNTHGFSLLSPLRKVGGELVWAVQYFCFGLVILETNLKTYVHFSSFMWQRQGRRDMPGKCSWNLPKSWAVCRNHVTRSLLQAGI